MVRDLPHTARGLFSYFTRHRTAANLMLVLMLVLGGMAIPNMRAQFFPDVIVESVTVSVEWEGAGPEDVDSAIVQVLEPVLLAVDGVEETTSTSREGSATLTLEFEPGTDMGQAADDVQSAVDGVTTLPEEAEEPSVRRGAWRDRVTDVVISGPVAPGQLGQFADELVVRLFEAGVTRTTIRGVAAPETIVEVPTASLITHDITMREIADAIAGRGRCRPGRRHQRRQCPGPHRQRETQTRSAGVHRAAHQCRWLGADGWRCGAATGRRRRPQPLLLCR